MAVARLYFDERMKPRHIARQLRISTIEIDKIVQGFKRKVKAKLFPVVKPKVQKVTKKDDPELKDHIIQYMKTHNYSTMRTQDLRSYLLQHMVEVRVPSLCWLRKIVKEDFHLKYDPFQGSTYKYQDPSYNEKRLWVSRLVAQFYKDQVIIVSVDESSFRSDSVKHRLWQFKPMLGKRRQRTISTKR